MKTSVKAGWVVFILASTILFSLIIAGSDDWNTYRVLVQEAIYEDVPASETRINAYWVGSTAISILVGLVIGLVIYVLLEEKETVSARKHERIHQCSRCGEFDEKDSYCITGGKDIYEPLKLRYCRRFKPK